VTLRDKALLSVMLFNVPRVSAVVGMRVRDFDDSGDGWLLLHEKRKHEGRAQRQLVVAAHRQRQLVSDRCGSTERPPHAIRVEQE